MGEKKSNIIGVTTFFLIIAIVAILVMGYYLYSSNSKILSLESKEAELNSTIENLKNTSSVKSETTTPESDSKDTSSEVKTSKMSFSELMDMIYVKNKTEIKGNSYTKYFNSSVMSQTVGPDGKLQDIDYVTITTNHDSIGFNMHQSSPDKTVGTTVKGISDEVVSVKILQIASEIYEVYFLTRTGDVYYINPNMMNSNTITAKKVSNVKEVISIETASVTSSGDLEGHNSLIATTYNGEKVNITE